MENNTTTTLTANNGNILAEMMHNLDILKSGLTLDQCEKEARGNQLIPPFANKWLQQDDFWEDFICRADELGYKLSL